MSYTKKFKKMRNSIIWNEMLYIKKFKKNEIFDNIKRNALYEETWFDIFYI